MALYVNVIGQVVYIKKIISTFVALWYDFTVYIIGHIMQLLIKEHRNAKSSKGSNNFEIHI